mgnify:CR=1 FL=1
MVEREDPNLFKTAPLSSEAVVKLEEALVSQGFQRLQQIPGMSNGHQILAELGIYEDEKGRIVVIQQDGSVDKNEVDYTVRSSFLVEDVLRNP